MLNKRKQGRLFRNSLDTKIHKEYSQKICERIKPIIADKKIIMLYNNIDNEVDVSYLFDKDKTILFPRVEGENMVSVLPQGFLKGSFNISEPIGDAYTGKIDAVIVPMCAFDNNFNRLGFGKGFYDRFLANHDCLKIGVAFQGQQTNGIIAKETDIKMDIIVTERGLLRRI